MADILDEVLTDVKDEKRIILFRKVLFPIIGITILIAIFMAGNSWYKNKNIEHNKKIGDMLVDIMSGTHGDIVQSQESLGKFVENAENKQAELAELKVVSNILSVSKDLKDAFSALESIIDNKDYDNITTSYARLIWVGIILDEKKISDVHQAQARDYLQHFTESNQVFYANATLLKALFYKKNKQLDLASEFANSLLTLDSASIVIKEQAKALLTSL